MGFILFIDFIPNLMFELANFEMFIFMDQFFGRYFLQVKIRSDSQIVRTLGEL